MIQLIGNIYAYLFSRPSFAAFNKGLFYLGGRGLGLKNYRGDQISGELNALKLCVPKDGAPVVFDVGANAGDWSRKVLTHNPAAQLHLFEPQAVLSKQLKAKFPNATVNICATSDSTGEAAIFDYAGSTGSEHASLLPGVIESIHARKSEGNTVRLITLDNYCHQLNITRIDFLKVDVEGYELKTLFGCRKLMSEGAIENIQFEFNEMNVLSRSLMRDFFDLLSPQFMLYRMLSSGLLPLEKNWHWLNEQFTYQNILASRSHL